MRWPVIALLIVTTGYDSLAAAQEEEWPSTLRQTYDLPEFSDSMRTRHRIQLIEWGVAPECLIERRSPAATTLASRVTYDSGAILLFQGLRVEQVPDSSAVSVLCGRVHLGMPERFVGYAWGDPLATTETATASGVIRTSTYAGGRTASVAAGKVVSVTNVGP